MVEYARTKADNNDDDDDWTQVVGRSGTWEIVKRDLLLLKNQIPFFIIQKLFEHLRRSDDDTLVKGGLSLFASLRPGPAAGSSSTLTCRDVHHLLHLFYLSAIGRPTPTRSTPRRRSQDDNGDAVPWVRCTKELEEAGLSFQPKKHKQQQPFFHNVSFSHAGVCGGGVLEIPPLQLHDDSERGTVQEPHRVRADLPAHAGHRHHACALFMDCLIKTPEDMRLLHNSGVLVSHMNGERDAAATGFFSRVCAQAHIFLDQNYLDDVMRDVVTYQSTRWQLWRAALIRNYFVNPWVTTSLIAALVVLVLTFLQTFFAVYAYYKPPPSN
jgi:hypothetical protein